MKKRLGEQNIFLFSRILLCFPRQQSSFLYSKTYAKPFKQLVDSITAVG